MRVVPPSRPARARRPAAALGRGRAVRARRAGPGAVQQRGGARRQRLGRGHLCQQRRLPPALRARAQRCQVSGGPRAQTPPHLLAGMWPAHVFTAGARPPDDGAISATCSWLSDLTRTGGRQSGRKCAGRESIRMSAGDGLVHARAGRRVRKDLPQAGGQVTAHAAPSPAASCGIAGRASGACGRAAARRAACWEQRRPSCERSAYSDMHTFVACIVIHSDACEC
jgi:hypothetical protein